MSKETFDKGLKIRKEVLGAEFVENSFKNADEFSMPMQELTTEYCWGYVWGREGLDKKTRSLLNLGDDRCSQPAARVAAAHRRRAAQWRHARGNPRGLHAGGDLLRRASGCRFVPRSQGSVRVDGQEIDQGHEGRLRRRREGHEEEQVTSSSVLVCASTVVFVRTPICQGAGSPDAGCCRRERPWPRPPPLAPLPRLPALSSRLGPGTGGRDRQSSVQGLDLARHGAQSDDAAGRPAESADRPSGRGAHRGDESLLLELRARARPAGPAGRARPAAASVGLARGRDDEHGAHSGPRRRRHRRGCRARGPARAGRRSRLRLRARRNAAPAITACADAPTSVSCSARNLPADFVPDRRDADGTPCTPTRTSAVLPSSW